MFLGVEEVRNDNVVDRRVHGGIEKAVYGYSSKHYKYFKKLHPNLDWNYGMFGENITFTDLNEEEIRVGNIYELGACKLKVTKPRQPCFKLGIRFGDPIIIKQFWESSMSGIYFKVLETGYIKINDELKLLKNSNNKPTIAEVYNTSKK